MHKLKTIIAVGSLVVASVSWGQTTTNYRDATGRVVGSSVTTYDSRGAPQTTNYRDATGQVIGSSVAYDNGTTNYRNAEGSIYGSSLNTPKQAPASDSGSIFK